MWLVGGCILQGYATLHITPSLSPRRTFPTSANAKSRRVNSLKGGSAFATTMIWREARVVRAEAKKGRHTQLGSGCLSCTLAFPASRRQPCGKALKRVTASRMRTVIMPCPVYRSVSRASAGRGGAVPGLFIKEELCSGRRRTSVLLVQHRSRRGGDVCSWAVYVCGALLQFFTSGILNAFGYLVPEAIHKDRLSSCDIAGFVHLAREGTREPSEALLPRRSKEMLKKRRKSVSVRRRWGIQSPLHCGVISRGKWA